MSKTYLRSFDYSHEAIPSTGILLVNLGTPEAPTPDALRKYLAEFLWDPRLTELPRWFWWLLLNGIILRTRPARSAKLYAKIWTESGSPLLNISQAQAQAVQQQLEQQWPAPIKIALGMRYGQPSIANALAELRQANAQRLLILPLYPQYSSPSTGSVFDAVADALKQWRWVPDVRFISDYHDNPAYITALTQKIRDYWQQHGQPDKLIFSYHGIPQRFFDNGDPYPCRCRRTSRLVAEQLGLNAEQWLVSFQSRFGKEEWVKPYTDETLQALGSAGTKRVDVVCAGFSADCLETLEEIDGENRHIFLNAGGQEFHYIPALNAEPSHIDALSTVLMQHLQGFPTTDAAQLQAEAQARVQRMQAAENV